MDPGTRPRPPPPPPSPPLPRPPPPSPPRSPRSSPPRPHSLDPRSAPVSPESPCRRSIRTGTPCPNRCAVSLPPSRTPAAVESETRNQSSRRCLLGNKQSQRGTEHGVVKKTHRTRRCHGYHRTCVVTETNLLEELVSLAPEVQVESSHLVEQLVLGRHVRDAVLLEVLQ